MKIRNMDINTGVPVVCVPVTESVAGDIVSHVEVLSGQADMIEWRVDFFDGMSSKKKVKAVLDNIRQAAGDTPLLVTLRTTDEGGNYEPEDGMYIEHLLNIAMSGCADIIDVEYDAVPDIENLVTVLHMKNVKLLLSHHDFSRTPDTSQMAEMLGKMRECGADIVKLAVMPQNPHDVTDLLSVTSDFHEKYPDIPVVTMSMGSTGVISRLAGETFGSCITFGSDREASAPGQIDFLALKEIIRLMHQTGEQ